MLCLNCKKRIPSKAKYCPYCQYPVKKYNLPLMQLEEHTSESHLQKRRIGILIFIIILLIAAILTILMRFYMNSLQRIESELKKGDYDTVVTLLNDRVDSDYDADFLSAFQNVLDQIYDGYYQEDNSYEDAKKSLEQLYLIKNDTLHEKVELVLEKVDVLQKGRTAYQIGEENYNEGVNQRITTDERQTDSDETIANNQNFVEALNNYSRISKIDDIYYPKAKEKFETTLSAYEDYVLSVSDEYYANGKYRSSYATLNNVPQMNYLCDDTEFVSLCSEKKVSVLEGWIENQRLEHLYFDSESDGAVWIARNYSIMTLNVSYSIQELINEGINWEKNDLLERINLERESRGMEKLIWSSKLENMAIESLAAVDLVACQEEADARKEEDTDGLLVNHIAENVAREKLQQVGANSGAYYNNSVGYYGADKFFNTSNELPEIIFLNEVHEIGIALIYNYDVNLIQWLVLTK